jgi:predicted acylesterase/phospholipase RssA
MKIKHLVISGGGPVLIQNLGTLFHLETNKMINIDEIESIYGTSAGAIVGVLLCLKFDWETMNDYIIKRPWHEVFPVKVQSILDSYAKKGIFDIKTIEKCLKPLLDAKDLSLAITLREFYEYSKIELHFFSFEINEFKIKDVSYLTNPDTSLMTAIQMTCAIPILMMPVCIDNYCFIDGGVVCNYPLSYCIDSGKNENEILGFRNYYDNNKNKNNITNESNMMDFMLTFLFKVLRNMSTENVQPSIKYEIDCDAELLNIEMLSNSLKSVEIRKKLFQNGIDSAIQFLEKIHNTIEPNVKDENID